MLDYVLECAGIALRWLHVVAAIAWIGESFYFVALDRGLKPPKSPAAGLFGESWSVHGGGFYHKQKYLPAPAELPAELHWSKWKSYTTWLSGFALFLLLYLRLPSVNLVDPAIAPLSPSSAVWIALAFPVFGWLAYDTLCKLVGFRDSVLGVAVAALVLSLDYAATHLFGGRAAFLLVGATLATMMSANVFFVIIPGQKKMVAALAQGLAPDPLPGQRGKQRSVHNTYFTLPVVFAMLSNHVAAAYAHPQSWLVLALVMAAGAAMRQFFVLWHGGERAWWLLGLGALLMLAVFVWLAPAPTAPRGAAPTTAEIQPIVTAHCAQCHSAKPSLMPTAPKGVMFDSAAQLDAYKPLIQQQVAVLKIMPPGNLTQLSDADREKLAAWSHP